MKKNNESPLEELILSYSEFGLHNADKFAPFLYAASLGIPNDANVMLVKLDALWTPIIMLHTYISVAILQPPTIHTPLTLPTELLRDSITEECGTIFISYANIMEKLRIQFHNIVRLDDNVYKIEGVSIDTKTRECWVILDNSAFHDDPVEHIEPAPEFGKYFCKLNRRYTDHLTLMAVTQMAIAIIRRFTFDRYL